MTSSNKDTRLDGAADADWIEAAKQFGYPPDITPGDIRYWHGGVKLAEVLQRARELAHHREAAAEWLPMSEAPRDGTVILGRTRSDMPEDENLPQWSAHRWNDRYVPMKHEGLTPSGYDLGWSVALPVGHGGLPDEWFIGWKLLDQPAPPPVSEEKES